ncbi:MAG TPA: SpoIID/LytB domain-containing protein [Fermentimonas caenicola]|jgi:stage II sporulation protein D|uniref:Sporulation stage II protein D amidase enhancer LytB N-terminal domain-containing protein n=1 Tax=Fermentimonas caenicola TaxID=1562970 RepID=A0A098BZ92_9BACT|nr:MULTISPECIES: SpoIID/LytB domain-containing protein [Lascolabacillus]MBP6175558.1 SpoIID/LytB domain-containing protein [Fermentimonas sp.]MDI9626357.1 SpoIID/LytB domain-containing protein [Bacteroidota bacterium]TAH61946.1 MAG: SpoIID/LytB domain-containing protein [Fermentimonas caenicola]MBP6196016.1 SpoIID/LytB domain-containing protein [Fermentimonas sp.]MBP7104227.1 SpoIID/LytB domain-containing protein [Fermentimonas sp.]
MGTSGEKENKTREPLIHVGILQNQNRINFSLLSTYKLQGKKFSKGDYFVEIDNGQISFNGERYDQLTFEADQLHKDSFEIKDVIIGVQFHWERKENQQFLGGLKFITTGVGENKSITVINIVSLEDYLKSVISSEMSSTSSEELLKAHSIISRSWLLAQIIKNKSINKEKKVYQTSIETPTEIIRWYDREDHEDFDVCADDHCQRYQGITRQTTELVDRVVNETWGKVISYKGSICDARYSKCCGGIMETFENVWEPIVHPYLQGKPDNYSGIPLPDLCIEEEAEEWIRSSPDAFCNTQNTNVLKQVLNDYDQETADFYRWTKTYSQEELSALIYERTGIDFGEIVDLQPLERGTSGRIIKLKIIGTEKVLVIGKELEIRRALSKSHLYSSAFVVDASEENDEGIPQMFVLTGAGWGHGVGLCQIGAAMMADKGYKYKEILLHYFPGSNIKTEY